MPTPWIIAVVSLWVLLGVVALAVVALARQVGILHLRVKPFGAGGVDTGPPVGSTLPVPELISLRSHPVELFSEDGMGVVLFVSATCGLCKPVLEGGARLQQVESGLRLTVAVDGEQSAAAAYLERSGFADGIAADDVDEFDSGNRPYAVAVDTSGLVLEAGAVNTLEQLENMVDVARRRLDGFEPPDENVQVVDNETVMLTVDTGSNKGVP